MKDQILKIIEAEGLTPAKFADEIGVQRSSISHIISGRNKPSYDFIIKIIERFRGINAEWLLTGKGSMIKSSANENVVQKTLYNNEKNDTGIENIHAEKSKSEEINKPESTIKTHEIEYTKRNLNAVKETSEIKVTNVNNDTFILVFYADGTYKKFNPRE
jgi:transcriptional regulator with XRE-family HTH domain